jgi:hypothetical protein
MTRTLAIAAVAVTLSISSPARSQPSTTSVAAEELFHDGRALLAEGRYREACAKLDASQKLDPAVGTLFSLGECYEAQARLASAWFAFRGASALAASRSDQRRAMAQARADAIEPHLAHIAIRLADPASHAGVSLDGEPIVHDALTTPLPVDPGPHRVEGGSSWSTIVQIAANGVTVEVEIPADAAAPLPPPTVAPRPASTGSPLLRTVGVGAVGTGAATLVVGSIFGMQAIVKGRDANGACPTVACSNAGAVHENGVAKTYADVATVLVPVGAALAAAGVVLFFTSRGSVEPTLGPGTARLDVKWSW